MGGGADEIVGVKKVLIGEEERDMRDEDDTAGDVLRVGDAVRGGVIERGDKVEGDVQSFRVEAASGGDIFPGVEIARSAATAVSLCVMFGTATRDFALGGVGGLSPLGVDLIGFVTNGVDSS